MSKSRKAKGLGDMSNKSEVLESVVLMVMAAAMLFALAYLFDMTLLELVDKMN